MKLSQTAKQYALEHIAHVAFPGIHTRIDAQGIPCLDLGNDIHVCFPLLSEEETEQLLAGTLPATAGTHSGAGPIPVFIPAVLPENDSEYGVLYPYDIITPSFLLLSRCEELRAHELDAHLRFPYSESLCHHYGCIDLPLVDYYALMLRQFVCERFPAVVVKPRVSALIPTHDIDFLCRFSGWFTSWKSIIGGDLLRDRSWRQAKESVRQLRNFRAHPLEDPMMLGIQRLIEASSQCGVTSEFYFKVLHHGEKDSTYEIDSMAVARAMEWIRSAGMIIGVHGSYDSYHSAERFGEECARVAAVAGEAVTRGRQHFLRFHALTTLSVWQQAGLMSDSTLGYSEKEGFRCGTCHPFPLYDLENDRPTGVIERPLIVMDTTLFRNYAGDLEGALQKMRQLYGRSREAEGDFVILWHNSSMFRSMEQWFQKVYLAFLTECTK